MLLFVYSQYVYENWQLLCTIERLMNRRRQAQAAAVWRVEYACANEFVNNVGFDLHARRRQLKSH